MKNDSLQPHLFIGVMHVNKDPWLSIVRDGQLASWEIQNLDGNVGAKPRMQFLML